VAPESRGKLRAATIWAVLAIVITIPVAAAAQSQLLAWRDPVYILAGFAGIFALMLMLVQPLIISGLLPLSARARPHWHRFAGLVLVLAVTLHVAGLWITSPPDVVDALLFVSPTPFSVWGVTAMWAVFAAAALALLRRRLRLRWSRWRVAHVTLVSAAVLGTVIHALRIEGTMEPISKLFACGLTLAALGAALVVLRRRRVGIDR
jgi:hypothetical protein